MKFCARIVLVLCSAGVIALIGVQHASLCRANLPDDWTDVDIPEAPPTPPSAPVYPVYRGPPPGYFRAQNQNNNSNTSQSGQMTPEQQRQYDGTMNNNLGCQAFKSGNFAGALSYFEAAVAADPNNHLLLANLAIVQNELGCTVLRNGSYEAALEYFNEAQAHDPNNSIYAGNIALVQRLIAQKRQAELQRQQDAAAVSLVGQSIRALVEKISSASSGGTSPSANAALTFQAPDSSPPLSSEVTLGFGDPTLTIPWPAQTLPPAVLQGISHDFADAPPEVQHSVTSGYLAIMHHDWALAKACFATALSHDPSSAPLQRLVSWSTMSAQQSPGFAPKPDPQPGLSFNAPGGVPDVTNTGPSTAKGPRHTEPEPPVPVMSKQNSTLMAKFMKLIGSSSR